MYRTGSLFYAIYFFVSFPMFFRMDEDTKVGAASTLLLSAGVLLSVMAN